MYARLVMLSTQFQGDDVLKQSRPSSDCGGSCLLYIVRFPRDGHTYRTRSGLCVDGATQQLHAAG